MDNAWLDEVAVDNTAMSEVKRAIEKWRELRFARDEAEEKLKSAEKKYNEYCNEVVAKVFRKNGLESLKLEDGTEVKVIANVRCSIQKEKKNVVAQWLREQGAENLVKSQLIVMPSNKEFLTKNGIGYDEEVTMNTNSVKAWVRGEMDMQNLSVNDLPSGLSWFMYDEIQVGE